MEVCINLKVLFRHSVYLVHNRRYKLCTLVTPNFINPHPHDPHIKFSKMLPHEGEGFGVKYHKRLKVHYH